MKCANGAKRRAKMGRLFYKPENAWVGDLIPYYENGTYYWFGEHKQKVKPEI